MSSTQSLMRGILSTKLNFGRPGTQLGASVSLIDESAMSRVERSWLRVSSDLDGFGLDFLTKVFLEVPEALALFPFARLPDGTVGMEGVAASDVGSLDASILRDVLAHNKNVVAHSRLVTREVGRLVSGMADVDEIVPRLRSLGRMHSASGVQPKHYDVFFRNLLETLREALDDDWTDETEEAWKLVHSSLATVMKRPAHLALEAEMPGRWTVTGAIAGAYMSVVTPLRLAGFTSKAPVINAFFAMLDAVAAGVFALELAGHAFLARVRLPKVEREHQNKQIEAMRSMSIRKGALKRRKSLRVFVSFAVGRAGFGVKFRALRLVKFVGMDQAVAWPLMDWLVLVSFLLQNAALPGITPRLVVGVHWTHMLGLLRIAALTRAMSTVQCLENCLIIYWRAGGKQRSALRVTRLLMKIAFVVHLSACLWFLVARVELGPDGEAKASSFFPEPALLHGENVVNSYARAVHWAWVQLAGIGDVDSSPTSTLECLTMLLVHICGATLYAIATGNIISLLEDTAVAEDQVGVGAADLSDFMRDASVPPSAQARIMQGFAMSSVVAADEHEDGIGGEGGREEPLEFPKDAAGHLPWHLQRELRTHALADALARRDRVLDRCTHAFRFAVAGSLREDGETLLPGDYLFQSGESAIRKVYVIERGSLAVTVEGQLVRTLKRGDMLGVPWMCSTPLTSVDSVTDGELWGEQLTGSGRDRRNIFAQFQWGEAKVGASIRAMELTTLAVGFSLRYEVLELQRRFPDDFAEFQSERERALASLRNTGNVQGMIHAKVVARRLTTHHRKKKVVTQKD